MADAPFYSDAEGSKSEEDGSEEEEEEEKKKKTKKKPYVMDSDHRLLLRNAKPLLQSRSAAVSQTHGTVCVGRAVTRCVCACRW